MKAILKLVTNRWLVRAVGLAAIIGIVLVVGPLLAIGDRRPLASAAAQWALIGVIVVGWVLKEVLAAQRAKSAQTKMVDALMQAPAAPAGPDASEEEVATIRQRFEEALTVLKKARGGKGKGKLNLYDLPWYIIIGPPGAGKTTALVNSGLHFPLRERFGPDALRGVGGTRNCDWWFTDEAVIIDTAGRYTTQDSDAAVDRAAWLGFLDLLKKYRKRRPINGTFVAISIADLMTQSEGERRAHAAAIKQRVMELDKHFGIRFPVYVLFTKCDLVAGFTEFFDDLARGEREQVWGFTFRYSDDPDANPVGGFGADFDALVRRLNERLLARIGQEPDPARRALIHGFPKQMAALKESLGAFLGEIFQSSRFETGPLLRGAYFTSGTQEGAPIDRLMGALARTFQLDAGALRGQQPAGKSYFITDLLKKLAFRESNLAGTNRRAELQRAWLQKGAYVATAAAVVLAVAAWITAYFENRAEIAAVGESAEQARMLVSAVDQHDENVLAALLALDAVRAIPGGYASRLDGASWLAGFGLSQSGKLGDQAVASYRRLLNQLFLSRLMVGLESTLRRGGPSPDYTYEALKAYLMLDSAEHYDPEAIKAFVRADWSARLPQGVSAAQRQALDAHLDALFEERPRPLPLPLSEPVVAEARREVRSIPLEQRIYGRLKRTFPANIAGFNVRDAAGGPTAELVFARKSGKPLSEPLPGLFTKAGYQQVFVNQSRELTSELAAETWIFGDEQQALGAEQRAQLEARVRDLYLDEFAALYSATLLDVTLAPFATAGDAARIFNILSRPDDSPLLLLLREIDRQTSLDAADGNGIVQRAQDRADQLRQRLQQVLGASNQGAADAAAAASVRNAVEERFGPLDALVRQAEGQPRPVDHLVGLFQELYQYLGVVVASEAGGGAIPPQVQQTGQAVVQKLRTEASTQPELLVGDLLRTAADRTAALTTGDVRTYLNELWQSGPLATCKQAIEGRYPVDAGSSQSVRLDDFAQFFGYGGVMDAFFNTNLRQYVDASASPWRSRPTANVPIQLSQAALQAFENADVIKRTFFRAGSMEPSIEFDLRPLEMDTSLARFLLDLEGAQLTYEFGPLTQTLMHWPGPKPGTGVRLELVDRKTHATAMDRVEGPWAWFRLLDRSKLTPTGSAEQFEVTFSQGGRNVIYELTARSAFNPFALSQLKRFRCPGTL
ncbi:MAG TPA: type VI secretion system membrane subunit TssM [Gammaproteobacteria bacterium]|nr:type VI secretion system membrane subunit TssM [Gammaproteobacteria bacterium]